MSDYASIMGGSPGDTLLPGDVGLDQDAYYRIETANVFLDRFDSGGDSIVDAVGNPNAIRIDLGSGADSIYTGAGADSIWSGAGDDRINAGQGANTVSGAAGDDFIQSGAGGDSLMGGAGEDTIVAGAGDDHVVGGSGNDTLFGQGGNDSVFGGSGADVLYGGDGDDEVMGGSGADTLLGGAGADSLFGGSGGDVFAFESGFGQDVISDFGPGDRIQLAAGLNGTDIASPADVAAMVTGGTTAAGTKFTVITIGNDTIRLEKVDPADFVNQIGSWVQVS